MPPALLKIVVAYGSILLVFGAMDFVWLSLTHATLYKPALGPILADRISAAPAVIFYLLYLAAVVYFAVWPALAGGGWTRALINGALFGLAAYATYDLTNQATLRIWSLRVTVADLCWGAFATSMAALVSFTITAWSSRAIS
jgi:uncharacterized membrane protein